MSRFLDDRGLIDDPGLIDDTGIGNLLKSLTELPCPFY